MTAALSAVLGLTGGVVAGLSLYLLTLAVAFALYRDRSLSPSEAPRSSLVVLIPAHDEERLIARAVSSLLAQSYPKELVRVVVIADNCSDQTAAAAAAAGAEVMERNVPDALGKGYALRWAMDRVLAEANPPDAVVVVDADSVASPDLLAKLEAELAAGFCAVQGDYTVLAEGGSPSGELIAAGFLLFHRVRFSGRAALGMAASLVGNGMLFSRTLLRQHPWDAFTGVEDLEYTIHLRMAGIRPRFAPAAVVSGPLPVSRAGAHSQRLRWEGGRFHVVRRWLLPLLSAAVRRRDAGLGDAALDLATPPLGLLCVAAVGGAVITVVGVWWHMVSIWALAPWGVAVAAIPAFVLIGLVAAEAPRSTFGALLGSPGFLMWKVLVYLRLLRGFDAFRWDRTDRRAQDEPTDTLRFDIAGIPVDSIDMARAISRLRAAIGGPKLFQVTTINLDFMVSATRDPEIRRIFRGSDLNLADGAPVVWLARLLGAAMPERVAGADLIPAMLRVMSEAGARVFLLGGEHGVAEEAAVRMRGSYPGVVVAGTFEPPRAAIEDMDNAEILARIDGSRPDVLLVAFGHPKQERWIDMHRERLPVSVAIGVGCVLDLMAGRSRRAPTWMQKAGLEWAFRLRQEPKRLFWRYLTDAVWLIPIAASALRARSVGRRAVEPA